MLSRYMRDVVMHRNEIRKWRTVSCKSDADDLRSRIDQVSSRLTAG